MADILELQSDDKETPGEEKGSYVSHFLCHNSYVSTQLCFNW